jgi:hypothetical protein
MTYIRHDDDNVPVVPQPGVTTVGVFTGTEGWTSIEYEDWNADYIRHDDNNSPVGIGSSYVRHDDNNQPVAVDVYQRHDDNNNPILV